MIDISTPKTTVKSIIHNSKYENVFCKKQDLRLIDKNQEFENNINAHIKIVYSVYTLQYINRVKVNLTFNPAHSTALSRKERFNFFGKVM